MGRITGHAIASESSVETPTSIAEGLSSAVSVMYERISRELFERHMARRRHKGNATWNQQRYSSGS